MKNEAFDAAVAEGLKYFWAYTHVGTVGDFVGDSWESGGFRCNERGEPVADVRCNTVGRYIVEELDAGNPAHVAACEEWYG